MILNIETSGKRCSVAVSHEGAVMYQREDDTPMNHGTCLAPFISDCLDQMHRHDAKPEAIAVSIGPGSYTGLRIGLSTAKGLCTGFGIPLIAVETLKILAVKAMFMPRDWSGDELILPMTDARRMEVYTAAYDFGLNDVMAPQPLILDADSYSDLLADRKCIFIGDGVDKAEIVIASPNAIWLHGKDPHAVDMVALSDKYFREGRFADVAYCVPEYLKEYQTTKPKPLL